MPFENGWMPMFIPGWGGKSSREEGSRKINAEWAEDAEFAEKRKARGGPEAAPTFGMLWRMKRTFLIDTDTASDDAVALIMALRHPGVEVVGITAVAGNVGVRQASRNALYTAELCGSSVAVFTGAEKPLKRAHHSADWFHGRDGLGDHGYPAPRRAPEKMGAAEAIVELIERPPGIVLGRPG